MFAGSSDGRSNVEAFVEWMRSLEVPDSEIFQVDDLVKVPPLCLWCASIFLYMSPPLTRFHSVLSHSILVVFVLIVQKSARSAILVSTDHSCPVDWQPLFSTR
jgi:hypothetical protein